MFENVIAKFSKFISQYIFHNSPLCQLEDVDIINRKVIIRFKGIAASVKIPLKDIAVDSVLISNLPSAQAAYLGYYCGINCNEFKYYSNIEPHTQYKESDCNCKIIMLDRKGNLVYFDKIKAANFISAPLLIFKSRDLIEKFNPIESFYIGILSGISITKSAYRCQSKLTTPSLRVVK